MPISRTRFLRTGALLLVTGLLALVAIIGTTVWLAERSQSYFNDVIEARNARTATVDLRNALQTAETSQRGFLLTGDEAYLARYPDARARFMPLYDQVEKVLKPYPQADQAVVALRQGIEAKQQELDETIRLAREGRTDEALAIVRTNQGRELMEQADLLFSGVIRAADERVLEGVTDQRANARILRWVTVLGGLLILAVVGGSVWTALAYTKELVQAQAEVNALNVGLEARVNERTQDLIKANEEVQRFAYIVTHDLRAPLVNIMGFTSELDTTMKTIQAHVLAEDDERDAVRLKEDARVAAAEDLPEAIGFIRSSTRKMDALINAILKISRDGRRPLKAEAIELKPMLELALASIQHQIVDDGGSARVEVEVDRLVSDKLSIDQIVGNLLDNAVKYKSTARPLDLLVRARRGRAGRIAIDVVDNGRGIAPEDHQRVFDLFRRAGVQDKAGEGIGLAHVRTLTRNLGGDITVSSEFGAGSTFTVELPADLRTVVRSEFA